MSETSIELEYPYNNWRKGYININKDNRRTVTLYNTSKDRSSVQYARYLLAVKLGRFLTDDEEADHIDEDKTNDCLSNLQVLTKKDHRAKNVVILTGVCCICETKFSRTKSQLRTKVKQEKLLAGELACSRKCGYVKTSRTLTKQ